MLNARFAIFGILLVGIFASNAQAADLVIKPDETIRINEDTTVTCKAPVVPPSCRDYRGYRTESGTTIRCRGERYQCYSGNYRFCQYSDGRTTTTFLGGRRLEYCGACE